MTLERLQRREEALRVVRTQSCIAMRTMAGLALVRRANASRGESRGAAFIKRRQVATEKGNGHACGLSLRASVLGALAGAPWVAVRVVRRSAGTLDDDNLAAACKAFVDGLAAAWGIDDRDPRIRYVPDDEPAPRGVYGVRVEVFVGGAP